MDRGMDRGMERGGQRARDMRTVFISQLAQRVTEHDLYEMFSEAGRVRDVRLIMDRSLRKHKSAGYVEFFDVNSVSKAVAMTGKLIRGYPVAVKPTMEGVAALPPRGYDETGRPVGVARPAERRVGWREAASAPTDPVVGWSTRLPMRSVQSNGSAGVAAAGVGVAVPGMADVITATARAPSPPKMVSVEELKRLLNPHNLPVGGSPAPTPYGGAPLAGLGPDMVRQQGLEPVPLPTASSAAAAAAVAAAAAAAVAAPAAPANFTRLYVGSVAFQLTETDLRAIFDPFGVITSLQLQREANGRSRGYGFVEYATHEAAKKALEINGLLVAGRTLKVALASQETRGVGATTGLVGGAVPLPGPVGVVGAGVGGAVGTDVVGELDEGNDSGLAINASQRVMLMQQLSRGETIGKASQDDAVKLPVTTEASTSLMLSNMFDPATEPKNFELELAEEVRDECTTQYGPVAHLHVEAKSRGIVFVRFQSLDAAMKARSSLTGRWFGGKMVEASFVKNEDYSKRFPNAPA